MTKSEMLAWICAIISCIAVWMQIMISNAKTKQIERLEGCIDAMIERQSNTNAVDKAKFVIVK